MAQDFKAERPMSLVHRLLWSALIIVLSGVLLAAGWTWVAGGSPHGARPELPALGTVPEFSLTERNDQTVSAQDLRGRVWIADFIFTNCGGTCPAMTSRMRQLQDALADHPHLRFVSFTVDPDRDTPEALGDYARRVGADPHRWLFLTGPKHTLYALARTGFRLGVDEVPEAERAHNPEPILHSVKFVLVDQEGRIRGYYDGTDTGGVAALREAVTHLLSPS